MPGRPRPRCRAGMRIRRPRPYANGVAFSGFPREAFEFYEQLEADNSKSFWQAHKDVYERACRAPMESLFADLEPQCGPAKIFRPYRDVRFSADKSPYKTQ